MVEYEKTETDLSIHGFLLPGLLKIKLLREFQIFPTGKLYLNDSLEIEKNVESKIVANYRLMSICPFLLNSTGYF